MTKKIILLTFFFLFFICALINISYILIHFQSSTLTIYQSFSNKNILSEKGTHTGGEIYFKKLKENMYLISRLKFDELLNVYSKIKTYDISNSEFFSEYEMIKLIDSLNYIPEKKFTAVYVSRNISEYWNISCDSHLPSFIIPGIANLVLINGLPNLKQQSCFGHLLEYGQWLYYDKGKYYNEIKLNQNELCSLIKIDNFKYLIYFDYDEENKIIYERHKC